MRAMKTNATRRDAERESFRLFLQSELAGRCARNAQYSLRSFALDLGLDHGSLGQMLRGKRRLTESTIRRLGRKLALSDERVAQLVATERLAEADHEAFRREAEELAAATANLISGWHHYAILELVKLEDFQPSSPWIARVLGIEVDEVNLALQRLLRLGLLEMSARERWTDLSGDTTASFEGFTRAALERLAAETSRLLASSLCDVPVTLHEHSTTTLAVRRARIPEAIERIARLRAELVELLREDERLDDVYQLEIHLFPVTKLRKGAVP